MGQIFSFYESLARQAPKRRANWVAHPSPKRAKKDAFANFYEQEDIWVESILPYLGHGHHAFVALVDKKMNTYYKKCCGKLKNAPFAVVSDDGNSLRRATSVDTYYGSALANESCAVYWEKEVYCDFETDPDAHALEEGEEETPKDQEFRAWKSLNYFVFDAIARLGIIPMLEWAREKEYPWRFETTCPQAARGGNLEALKWLRKNGCEWNKFVIRDAASEGHVQLLKWAHKNGCRWHLNSAWLAASNGHLGVLEYIYEVFPGMSLGSTCASAAKSGHLHILQWAYAQDESSWDEDTCCQAASGGHLEMLKYVREKGCAWDERTCQGAASGGHLEVLKYARENKCPWSVETCNNAGANGHLGVLSWARANGCPWNSDVFFDAARNGHLDVLIWVEKEARTEIGHGLRCSINIMEHELCKVAGREGYLEILKWARKGNKKCFPWDTDTSYMAAKNGHSEVLKWAFENGCPWDSNVCSAAAMEGHLACLKYAVEHGCPWEERGDSCRIAVRNGHFEIVKYAQERDLSGNGNDDASISNG